MQKYNLDLYIEINSYNYVFFVVKKDEQNDCKIALKLEIPLNGIDNNRVSNIDLSSNVIKENIFLIEKKFNYTFKSLFLIIDNFNPQFINISGYKKLNGSQVLKENITYILNTLKSCVEEIEEKKKILHIFNSKFYLDKKKIENLPIGLFGDFYCHELSFILIHKNDYKNIHNIFDKCSLKIKKILVKNFIKGALISEKYKNMDSFFFININDKNSKIFYFENNSLKFEQNFPFGFDIVIKDVSKITSLKFDSVKKIIEKIELNSGISKEDLLEKKFFTDDSYRKIKKKLIYDVALARIQEISELILLNNTNLNYYNKRCKNIFIETSKKNECFKEICKTSFKMKGESNIYFLEDLSFDGVLATANTLVHYGWKKEAIPFTQSKKSIITRFFDTFFS